jgi:hypothetical protein
MDNFIERFDHVERQITALVRGRRPRSTDTGRLPGEDTI